MWEKQFSVIRSNGHVERKYKGSFFDSDYFERGRETGKSWLEDYHWMPRRSFREALAFIDHLGIDDNSYVLDFGCAKGFLVRALRKLDIRADGCDISSYALKYAPKGSWNCTKPESFLEHVNKYTHIICKDVLEHLNPKQLHDTLKKLLTLAPKMMVVVPIGDSGTYRIKEYHTDASHQIIEDENWWKGMINNSGWDVKSHCNHVSGLKDNWVYVPDGNHVFIMQRNT